MNTGYSVLTQNDWQHPGGLVAPRGRERTFRCLGGSTLAPRRGRGCSVLLKAPSRQRAVHARPQVLGRKSKTSLNCKAYGRCSKIHIGPCILLERATLCWNLTKKEVVAEDPIRDGWAERLQLRLWGLTLCRAGHVPGPLMCSQESREGRDGVHTCWMYLGHDNITRHERDMGGGLWETGRHQFKSRFLYIWRQIDEKKLCVLKMNEILHDQKFRKLWVSLGEAFVCTIQPIACWATSKWQEQVDGGRLGKKASCVGCALIKTCLSEDETTLAMTDLKKVMQVKVI